MPLAELFFLNLFFIFCPILNFSKISFPARNAPTQKTFEAINRMEIAIEEVFKPNFKNGIRIISPQKI